MGDGHRFASKHRERLALSVQTTRLSDYLSFIQTAIQPGNSWWSPDDQRMRGEVGINSQIYSRSGGFSGISFAIPMGCR
jgi:S1-C subfamily serine protease